MGIFVGIGNYIGRVRQIGDGGGQPIGPNDYYIITEDEIAVLTERGKHILLDKYVTEDEIAAWVKEHMVFWYDMSKPINLYVSGVTYANQFVNDGGKLRYDTTINKCTITHTPTSANKNFWQIQCTPSSTIDSYKIRVTGLPKGFIIQSGFYSNKITSDGEYNIASYTNTATSTRYPGFYLAGGNVSDVDCNIVVEEIPTRQSVPTNEILKVNPYLQDHSGNNRPLKLFNFLFAGMSGVGGYSYFSESIIKTSSNWYESLYRGSNNGSPISFNIVGITELNSKNPQRGRIEILDTDASKVIQTITSDGEYNSIIPSSTVNFSIRFGGGTQGEVVPCNVVISPIPLYPNALVTDGADDYGQVQNLQQGVKMLFTTINPFVDGKFIYDQRFNTTEPWLFAVFNDKGSIAYNSRNSNGKTYIDGVLNESTRVSALLNKKQIITITNNDVVDDKTKSPVFFSNSDHTSGWINSAFYNSIGFDAVPEGNVTLQRVIDYVINNILNKA